MGELERAYRDVLTDVEWQRDRAELRTELRSRLSGLYGALAQHLQRQHPAIWAVILEDHPGMKIYDGGRYT
jgi:hypothetical protein